MKEKIKRLAEIIEGNVKNAVKGKEVAISFSGGLDSTTLAFLSKRYAKKVVLYTVGVVESQDVKMALEIGKKLNLKHKIYLLEREEILKLYKEVKEELKLDFVKADVLLGIKKLAQVVEEKTALFGSCTEELFLGYDRYYRWIEERIGEEEINKRLEKEYKKLFEGGDVYCIKKLFEKQGKKAVFPFCDKRIKEMLFSIPIKERARDKEKKKHVLREVARYLGVVKEAVERPKKAMQYGSGMHKELLKALKKEKKRSSRGISRA